MSASKYFDKIAWALVALMLIITAMFMCGASLGIEVMVHTMGYETRLFDNSRVHTIDIVMNNWDEFIANAEAEEYYRASLVIDGEAYKNVAIRGKGNTSLSTVSSLGSERYSFKVEFDHYDSSVTYHGLDKLSLNNLIQDSTMMKDYLTYTMMGELGAAAPLCSFVYITVNGDDWGLYLAVEGVEDSFLERNYGSDYGELYKPDSLNLGGGRGNGMDFDMGDFDFSFSAGDASSDTAEGSSGSFDPSSMFGGGMSGDFDTSAMPEGFDPSSMFGDSESGGFDFGNIGGMMGGFGMGSSDVKLQYTDDNFDSYSNIWNGAKTDITDADKTRLIASLKTLASYENVESVVDVEAVIKYFVVHNYVCNGDSYTGSMIHNYYLYEENGKLSMLPWDYNLAFGTFQGGNAQSTVNTPIDTPVSGGTSDRPMINWIYESEEYTQLYHEYFAQFIETVDIQGIINDAYTLIAPYVEKDPTAFYSYEEFEQGVSVLREFCALRSDSISLQLENGETTANMSYVDASHLNLSDMGSMSMGGGNRGGDFGGFGGSSDKSGRTDRGDKSDKSSDKETNVSATGMAFSMPTGNTGGMPDGFTGEMPDGFTGDMPDGFTGGMPDGFTGEMPDGFTGGMPDGFTGEMPDGFEGFGGTDGGTPPASDDTTSNISSDTAAPDTPEPDADGNTSVPDDSQNDGGTADSDVPQGGTQDGTARPSGSQRPSMDNMQIPSMNGSFGTPTAVSGSISTVIWLVVSLLVLAVGLIVAKLYRY